jgi:hypothetical protein
MRELKADNLIGRDWRELADEISELVVPRQEIEVSTEELG